MGKRLLILFLLFSFSSPVLSLHAQNSADTDSSGQSVSNPRPAPKPFVFKPTFGLGVGRFSYFGDLYQKHLVNPQVSRIGYELNLTQPITPYLNLGFYALFGKLGGNERLIYRNINFESQIRVGGIHFEYTFDNFLKPGHKISPWITCGFESFEFLSKTDLYDANGNLYHYWSDGSIRSLDENDPFAAQASFLQRDYVYETDIREENIDGFGKYAERSFAVPIGAGFRMHLNDKWDAKIGMTIHYSFTDYIDGITATSTGNRQGNAKNDHFVYTGFTLSYNLTGPAEKLDSLGNDPFSDVDYYAIDQQDYDHDNVIDLKDSCAGTPAGVAVDEKGCPLDEDGDRTPDYRDREAGTSKDLFTDEQGIGLTDSTILRRWNMYNDSTGEYFATKVIIRNGQNLAGSGAADRKVYTVSLGKYSTGIPNDLMTKLLSVSDVSGSILPDSSTIYTAGKFTDLRDAEKRRKQLEQAGFDKPVIVYRTANGNYAEVKDVFTNSNSSNTAGTNSNNGNSTAGNQGTNNGTNSTAGNNGNSSNSNNGNSSSNGNASGTNNGNGSSTANNNSNSNSNSNANGNSNSNSNSNANTNSAGNTNLNSGCDTCIVYRVQLGAFARPISKSTFADVPDLTVVRTDDGLYKYMSGSYTSFEAATNAKVQLLVKGYNGAFITAYKGGKRIPLEKAGAVYMKVEKEDMTENKEKSADVKSMVEFRVQLGVFKNEPPSEVKEKLNKVQGVKQDLTQSGLNRFTVGSTNDYAKINALRDQMKAQGFPDAFVIAYFKGQQITIPEALELLK